MKGIAHRLSPYTILSRVWFFVTFSLALDLLLSSAVTRRAPATTTSTIAIWLALMTLPFLNQAAINRCISKLRTYQRDNLVKISRLVTLVILLGFLVPTLIKLVLLLQLDNILMPMVLAFVIIIAGVSLLREIRQAREYLRRANQAPWTYIERWERQLIAISILPMLTARSISLCGLFSDVNTEQYVSGWYYSVASLVLLSMLKPRRESFFGLCTRCKHPVPLVYVDYGSCPQCSDPDNTRVIR